MKPTLRLVSEAKYCNVAAILPRPKVCCLVETQAWVGTATLCWRQRRTADTWVTSQASSVNDLCTCPWGLASTHACKAMSAPTLLCNVREGDVLPENTVAWGFGVEWDSLGPGVHGGYFSEKMRYREVGYFSEKNIVS